MNNFSQYLADALANTVCKSTLKQKLCYALLAAMRKLVCLFGNFQIRYRIPQTKHTLTMPLSHRLYEIASLNEMYDTYITRVCEALRESSSRLCLIDIGANIGDTALRMNPRKGDCLLCVEPAPEYAALLKKNTKALNGVCFVETFLGARDETQSGAYKRIHGTGYIDKQSQGDKESTIKLSTLDSLLEKNHTYKEPDFIKVDTDGYDFNILMGAEKVLRQCMPVLSFECWHGIDPDYETSFINLSRFLVTIGYKRALFYDNSGVPLTVANLSDEVTLRMLAQNQMNHRGRYLDCLTGSEAFIEKFITQELETLRRSSSES